MQQILSEIRDKFRTIHQNSVLLTRSQTFLLHLILRDVRSSEIYVALRKHHHQKIIAISIWYME